MNDSTLLKTWRTGKWEHCYKHGGKVNESTIINMAQWWMKTYTVRNMAHWWQCALAVFLIMELKITSGEKEYIFIHHIYCSLTLASLLLYINNKPVLISLLAQFCLYECSLSHMTIHICAEYLLQNLSYDNDFYFFSHKWTFVRNVLEE